MLVPALAGCERTPGGEPAAPATPSTAGAAYVPPATGLVIVDPPAPYVTATRLGDVQERPYFHDFGRVLFGEMLERTFHLENREGRAVTVHDLLPNCGCTVPEILARTRDGEVLRGQKQKDGPLLVVPEGAEVEVKIRIDTRRAPFLNKDKLAQVRMRTDATDPYLTFELHLFVQQPLTAEPAALDLGLVPTSTGGSASTWVRASLPEEGTHVGAIESVQGPFTARLEEEQRMDVRLWKVTVESEPGQPIGALRGSVRLTVLDGDGERDGAPFEIPIQGRVTEDVVIEPPALHLGPGARTATAELRALIPGARVRVVSTELESTDAHGLVVRATPIDPDTAGRAARWTITLEAPAGAEAHSVSGRVHVALDDPSLPEVSAPFTSALR